MTSTILTCVLPAQGRRSPWESVVLPRGSSADLTDRTSDGGEEAAAAALAGDPADLGGGTGVMSAGGAEPQLELLWEWSCERTQGFTVTCLAWCKARALIHTV